MVKLRSLIMSEMNEEMPLMDHLKEFRFYLFLSIAALTVASVVCFHFYDRIFALFFTPFGSLQENLGDLLFINYIHEGFLIKLKLSVIAGAVFSLPVHILGLVSFIFPGLTGKEQKIIGFCLVVSFVLSGLGFFYGYFYIIPISIQFFTGKGFMPEGVGMLLNLEKNVFYIIRFLLGAVLLFQIPIILEVLLILKIISRKKLFRASRYIILLTFLVSALFTPPDFVSQVAVALPLIVLYFLALLIAFIFRFGKEDYDV